ncbi:MAG TPA: cell division protein FtsA [Vicinamibacteria bacterium]|nr:cell division protein FtsA [Vicinamibacteria bacterium]
MVDERKDHLWKVAQEVEERIDELDKTVGHPLGIDVGTSKVVAAQKRGKAIETAWQLNAFIPVPYSRFTETILGQNEISYFREADQLVIYGTATERFANMFNAECRRPMSDGLLNPKEKAAMPVLETIIQSMVSKARVQGEVLAFSVPAACEGREAQLTYHEATLRSYFEGLGYKAVAINEGLAVIFSELESNNFTGIGISCGGGMCNATLAYLSIPSLMFSIPRGGDHIDQAVGTVVNEHATRVKVIKEESLDLSRSPKDKIEKALHIYYEELTESLVEALRRALSAADKLPKAERPLPIVLSGGTAKPRGFRDMFERALRRHPLPVEISELRMAQDPLIATAKGALIAAMYEK